MGAEATATATRPVRQRADAHRNRERIIAAAREVFVESGPDAPLDEIARRAGVGNATLYRNFADRRELFRTVMLSALDEVARGGETAMAEEPDAFGALARFVHESAEARVGALCTLLGPLDPRPDVELSAATDHVRDVVESLLRRARSAGQLRADVGASDVMLALAQLTRPLAGSGCGSIQHFVHRHLQLFLDGLRAPARSVLPGAPSAWRTCAGSRKGATRATPTVRTTEPLTVRTTDRLND